MPCFQGVGTTLSGEAFETNDPGGEVLPNLMIELGTLPNFFEIAHHGVSCAQAICGRRTSSQAGEGERSVEEPGADGQAGEAVEGQDGGEDQDARRREREAGEGAGGAEAGVWLHYQPGRQLHEGKDQRERAGPHQGGEGEEEAGEEGEGVAEEGRERCETILISN